MARRYIVKERQAYCDKWRTSGLSKIRFCAEEKISESALHLKDIGLAQARKQTEWGMPESLKNDYSITATLYPATT